MRLHRIVSLFAALLLCGSAAGQVDIVPELKDRPPVAAPTSKISVGAIAVVLSKSEMADYFVSGLVEGLMTGHRLNAATLIAVERDHVTMRKNFGTGFEAESSIAFGRLSEVFAVVAAMQLVEQGKLSLAADIGGPLGESGSRGITLQQLLTHQAGDAALLVTLIEKVSRESIAGYVGSHILKPLGMGSTQMNGAGVSSTASDMSRLMIALLTGGTYENGRILTPASVELMQRTSFILHPALPGRTYGFTEMRRNGWRALQHDGEVGDVTTRLVLIPEAKIGYLIAAKGADSGDVWHALDNGFFDRLLAARGPAAADASGPSPNAAQAADIAGSYEAASDSAQRVAPLKTQGQRLLVEARGDGALVFAGIEQGVLSPREGGYWSDDSGNLVAVARDGRLLSTAGDFVPLAFWKRPLFFIVLGLAAAIGGAIADRIRRRGRDNMRFPSNVGLGAAAATVLFLIASVLVWLLAPVA